MDGNDVRTITLLLTNSCNLDCVYCYEKYKSQKKMSLERAKEILHHELDNDKKLLYVVDFFGGEPFLCFDIIKELVHYVKVRFPNKQVKFSISTNGTLVHGEIQDWLREHYGDVQVGLSFDGNEKMQNRNRSNSFDLVDLDFFSRCFPKQKIKMTISPDTLDDLADGVIFLHEKGFGVACNLAYSVDWENPKYQSILAEQLFRLIEYYLANPGIEPCTMLNFSLKSLDGTVPKDIRKWCGSGTHMIAYDCNGESYPCHFFMPITIGESKAAVARNMTFSDRIERDFVDEKCRDCKLARICPTCIGSNYDETGNLYHKSNSYCALMKTVIRANSFMQAKKIELGQSTMSENDLRRIIRGILVAQEETVAY